MILKIKTYIIRSLLLCSLMLCLLMGSIGGIVLGQLAESETNQPAMNQLDINQAAIASMLDLPSMKLGTQIQIVSPDLTINFGLASVVDGELILETELEPYDEVRLLISHAGTGEVAMPTAFVSEDGTDLMLHIPDAEFVSEFVSFRQWLSQERGLRMIFPRIAASN